MRGTITAANLDEQYATISCDDGSTYRVDFSELPAHIYPKLTTPIGLRLLFDLSPCDLSACNVYRIAGIRD